MKHDAIIMQFDTVLPFGGLASNALNAPSSRKKRKQRNLSLESNPVNHSRTQHNQRETTSP